MFKAIGFVIGLYAITQMLSGTMRAFDSAMVAVFSTVETAADVSKEQLEQMAQAR